MTNLLQGSLDTPQGVTHDAAVARIFQLSVYHPPNIALSEATIVVNYYHTQAAMEGLKEPVAQRAYRFTVGGQYPFQTVLTAPGNPIDNLFTYFQGLPEFNGWAVVQSTQ